MNKILVWDWPVRLGHWLMVGGFAIAWLTAESESLALVHALAGGTVVAVAAFRVLWGLFGSRYARFADFVRGPRAVMTYIGSLADARPEHHVGHNPAGGWAIVALLGLALAVGASGLLNYNDIGGDTLKELHEGLAATMLTVVAVHVAGVLVSSFLHRENLVRAMLTGRKEGEAGQSIASTHALVAAFLLAWVAVAGWVIVS